MFYVIPLTIAAGHTSSNPVVSSLELSAGVIHQVDVLFPDTANNCLCAQIWSASQQLWPSNRGQSIRGDALVISFRDFLELNPSTNLLTFKAWWETSETTGTIYIHVGVLPKHILQPFSLAELLKAIQAP